VIKFNEYFTNWLYSDDGYYSHYKDIGKSGDFYTAVSTSAYFGGSIAKKIIKTIDEGFIDKNTTILEVGAHHGYLLADIIQFIYTLKPELLDTLTFAIAEKYEHLRIKQEEYLRQSFGCAIKLEHYTHIEEIKKESAIIIANEIFDAFTCDLVYTNKNNDLQQGFVVNNKIEFITCEDERIINICKKYKVTKGEVSLGFEEFAKTLDTNFKKYEFITFDYGEKYPRNDFSCRIYENHKVYPLFEDDIDLSKLYKNSDITYDVNFTHLIESFENNNAICTKYETQLKALVDFGIIDLLEILHENASQSVYLKEANQIKTLLEPTGMGDRFKVTIFRKNNV
jgi:SAM-dependent MidA family methyltransferase